MNEQEVSTGVRPTCTACLEPCRGPTVFYDNDRRPFCCFEHLLEEGELDDTTGSSKPTTN
jgi:hypothetical protein